MTESQCYRNDQGGALRHVIQVTFVSACVITSRELDQD